MCSNAHSYRNKGGVRSVRCPDSDAKGLPEDGRRVGWEELREIAVELLGAARVDAVSIPNGRRRAGLCPQARVRRQQLTV